MDVRTYPDIHESRCVFRCMNTDKRIAGTWGYIIGMFNENDTGIRCIMPVFGTGTPGKYRRIDGFDQNIRYHVLQSFNRDSACTQNDRCRAGTVHDGRFEAYLCLVSFQNTSNTPVHILIYGFPRSRAWSAGSIGRRRSYRTTTRGNKLLGHRQERHANADRWQAGCYGIQYSRVL